MSTVCKVFSGFLAVAAAAGVQAQQTAYAIGNGGSTLLRFSTSTPGVVTQVGNFSGADTFLDALDFRPATGELFGYRDFNDTYYRIDLATGALTVASVGASAAPTNTFQLGMDFNPSIDRLRVVTDSAQNIVYNPVAGTAAAFTTLAYDTADANVNTSPMIIDNAYSNNLAGTATTQQYAIDYGTDSLVTLANNTGVLATVGALGVNTDTFTGFDIFTSAGGVNTAYAILSGANGAAPAFYTINLTTGAATSVGALGFTNQVYSLAIVPTVVPGPAALALLGVAGVMVRRRRK